MKQLGNSVAIDAVKECAAAIINYMCIIDNRNINGNNMSKSRNKREWTELYSFLKLILDKKIIFSDAKLNPTEECFEVNRLTTAMF